MRQKDVASERHHHSLLLERQGHRPGLFGPVRRSAVEDRFFHLANVFWLTPRRLASALRLS